MNKKYCVHPREIVSKYDAQIHYIGYAKLIELYCLDPAQCCRASVRGLDHDMEHIYPRYEGDYPLFEKGGSR